MGYPYSWNNNSNAGIEGPCPQSMDVNTIKKDFDLYGRSDTETFFAGFTKLDYKSLIRASLQRIMMTSPGERVMTPTFGCDLRKYIFEPNDSVLEIDIKFTIIKAIQEFEPRVQLKDIEIQREDNRLLIIVPYNIKGTDMSDQISYILS